MPRSPKGKQTVTDGRTSSSSSVAPSRMSSAVPSRIPSSSSSSSAAVPSRITSTTVLPPRLSSVPPPSSDKLPPRKAADKAKEYIRNNIDNVISSSDDEDWNFDEDGLDESLAENLHDFFKQQKKTTDATKKKIYTYLYNTMDKKNDAEYDSNDLTKLGIDAILPSLNTDLNAYYKEEGFDETPPLITKDFLDRYLDYGIDDDYEEDGWIIKDE